MFVCQIKYLIKLGLGGVEEKVYFYWKQAGES